MAAGAPPPLSSPLPIAVIVTVSVHYSFNLFLVYSVSLRGLGCQGKADLALGICRRRIRGEEEKGKGEEEERA